MTESVAIPGSTCVRVRLAVYAAVLAVFGSWVCFRHLDRGMLQCDEASFAYTSDRMARTGDWVVPYINDRGPHLNAAPLYNWLTNLTGPLFGESNLKYRAWSAVFGVGCALAVLVLGALLFRAEVGFVAGLFLITNFQFVFVHGARWCVMESALAFFVTAMVACYVRTTQVTHRVGLWWALVGLFLGLATLTKPPAMGGFFFCVLCLHHLATRRDLSRKARLLGPLGAGVVAAVVALPWYIAMLVQVGPDAIERLFVTNSVGRATRAFETTQPPPTYYLANIWEASWGFRAALPAMVIGMAVALLGWNRRAWGLLAVVVVPFLLAISNATTKHIHYAYAAYPFLALAAAGLVLAGLTPPRSPESHAGRWIWRGVAVLGVVAAGFAFSRDLRTTKHAMAVPRFGYVPLVIHQQAEEDLAAGRVQLLLYQFPFSADRLDRTLGFTAHDRYYLDHMPHAIIVRNAPKLNRLLAEGKPTIVILPPLTPREEWLKDVQLPPNRAEAMQSDLFTYPVLTFHGAKVK